MPAETRRKSKAGRPVFNGVSTVELAGSDDWIVRGGGAIKQNNNPTDTNKRQSVASVGSRGRKSLVPGKDELPPLENSPITALSQNGNPNGEISARTVSVGKSPIPKTPTPPPQQPNQQSGQRAIRGSLRNDEVADTLRSPPVERVPSPRDKVTAAARRKSSAVEVEERQNSEELHRKNSERKRKGSAPRVYAGISETVPEVVSTVQNSVTQQQATLIQSSVQITKSVSSNDRRVSSAGAKQPSSPTRHSSKDETSLQDTLAIHSASATTLRSEVPVPQPPTGKPDSGRHHREHIHSSEDPIKKTATECTPTREFNDQTVQPVPPSEVKPDSGRDKQQQAHATKDVQSNEVGTTNCDIDEQKTTELEVEESKSKTKIDINDNNNQTDLVEENHTEKITNSKHSIITKEIMTIRDNVSPTSEAATPTPIENNDKCEATIEIDSTSVDNTDCSKQLPPRSINCSPCNDVSVEAQSPVLSSTNSESLIVADDDALTRGGTENDEESFGNFRTATPPSTPPAKTTSPTPAKNSRPTIRRGTVAGSRIRDSLAISESKDKRRPSFSPASNTRKDTTRRATSLKTETRTEDLSIKNRSRSVDFRAKSSNVTQRAKEALRKMSARRGSSEVQVNFLKAKEWRKKANLGFSRGAPLQVKPLPRRLWHDINEGTTANELVTHDKENDPLEQSEEWIRYTKTRKQGSSHAVILAVSEYSDSGIPDIPMADYDCKTLKAAFTECNYTLDVLQNGSEETFLEPTRENFLRIFDLAMTNAKKTDIQQGDAQEKEEFLLERTPGICVIIIARGCEGSLTFLSTGYNSRFAFTSEAAYSNDRKHVGIIPLASLMQTRDNLGRRPLVICDLWPLKGGMQSIRGQPGLAFIGGFESVAGELDAQYMANHEGLLTYYLIKSLYGKAGRSSVITTCAMNAYISDRLLKLKVQVMTEANHLTSGNRPVIDREASSTVRKQFRGWCGLTRWHRCRWICTGEMSLEAGPRGDNKAHVLIKTQLLKETYRLLYRSNQPHPDETIQPVRLVIVSDTSVVALHLGSAILNPAEGYSVWLDSVRDWAKCPSDNDITSVTIVRCSQVVLVHCNTTKALQLLTEAKQSNDLLLNRAVKSANIICDFMFTGCLRDFHKMNKALRISSYSKCGIKFTNTKMTSPADESKHIAATAVQKLWRAYFLRRRQDTLRILFEEQNATVTALHTEQSTLWENILESNCEGQQVVLSDYESSERQNLKDWEFEDRDFIQQRLIASWSKMILSTSEVEYEQYLQFFELDQTVFNSPSRLTRGAITAWERINTELLEAVSGQVRIIHEEISHNIFRFENLSRNEVWSRHQIAQEEYTVRLMFQRQANVLTEQITGLRIHKSYRPIRPVATNSEVRWSEVAASEQQEIQERKEIESAESNWREVQYENSQWLRAELNRISKTNHAEQVDKQQKRDKYVAELEKEILEEEIAKEEEQRYVEDRMKSILSQQEDQRSEESRRRSDAVKRLLISSGQTSDQTPAGTVVRNLAYRSVLGDEVDQVTRENTTANGFVTSTKKSPRNSLSEPARSGPARRRSDSNNRPQSGRSSRNSVGGKK